MNLDELLLHAKGEILANKATAIIDNKYTVLAVAEGSEWVFTEEGRAAIAYYSNLAAENTASQKPRKLKSMLVESQVAASEPVIGLQPQGTP